MNGQPLRLALPKGSLEDATLGLLVRAGLPISRLGSSLRLTSPDPSLDPVLLRPQEIPVYVAEGLVDAGVTGYDWIAERACEERTVTVTELHYSKVQTFKPIRWVLAVEDASPIADVDDLRRASEVRPLRVASELRHVTEQWLAANHVRADVTFSWGATEAKVPAFADAIVECTETGGSLLANGLRMVTTVLESTIRLIAAPAVMAERDGASETVRWVGHLLDAALRASRTTMIRFSRPTPASGETWRWLEPSVVRVTPAADEAAATVEVVVDRTSVAMWVRRIRRLGGTGVVATPVDLYLD